MGLTFFALLGSTVLLRVAVKLNTMKMIMIITVMLMMMIIMILIVIIILLAVLPM